MAIALRQELRLTQQLVMTPQLQQAIKLLQLSRLELLNTVQQELQENPVLEEGLEIDEELPGEISKETESPETSAAEASTDHLENREASDGRLSTDGNVRRAR